MPEEVEEGTTEYLNALEEQNKQLKNKNSELTGAVSNSSFNNKDGNLIKFQLESNDIPDKIEHFLKGDMIKVDQETGDVYYEEQKNQDFVILNTYGVNIIMQILGNYVNRNTNLSFYDEERVNEILADLGDELADFILCNYEKIGLDTEYKKSRYKLLVLNILHIIESAYRRALGGKEREGINSTRIVTQTEGLGSVRDNAPPKKSFNLFNRKTW